MQCDFGGQPSLKPLQRMRTFTIQAKHVKERAFGRFNDLPKTGAPAAPAPRPRPRAVVLRGTDDHGSIPLPPVLMQRLTFKAGVGEVRAVRRRSDTGQRGVRRMACGEESLRQRLILGAAGSKAKAGDYTLRSHREQQVKALIPAQPITPAKVCQTR